ncbi:ferric reductase like transmembrane component-domain-containing protein [Chiua virens]|nr:ferric reductase like transmembrane component-domain-containing protein [Chiua virens]
MAVDAFQLVFHINIFICAIVVVFALSTLPRALARFSSAAEWRHGHILRSIRLGPARLRGMRAKMSYPHVPQNPKSPNEKQLVAGYTSSAGHESQQDDVMTEESHTYVSHVDLLRYDSTRTLAPPSNLPPHVRAWSAVSPPLGAFLRHRLDVGLSVGQGLILGLYATILVYASCYKSNPFKDPVRMGVVAMSQIPVVYMLGTKNNLIGMFVGMGYEKLNYIHRFAGLMMFILSNFHALGYIYTWTFRGKFVQNMKNPTNQMGLVALIALDVLCFFSIPFWRRKAYNIFIFSHIICFVVFPPMAYAHEKRMLPWMLATGAIYGLDRIFHLLKTRIFNARIRAIPDLSVTRIEIPALNAGWRAGQHVRIRVLSSAMGLIGWMEVHPFTIASVAKTPEGLVLLCKNVGGWTNRLNELAKVAGYGCEDGELTRSITVMIDGPYGGAGHSVFASYSAAMFVVGGSGITFALSAIQDLIQRDQEDASRVKIIELVWSIQDPSKYAHATADFGALHSRGRCSPKRDSLPPGLTLTAGRPRIAKVLDAVIARAVSYGSGVKAYMDITGVIVCVCGPVGLGDEVAEVVSEVDPGRRWAVGGIEIHEETFIAGGVLGIVRNSLRTRPFVIQNGQVA